MKHKTQNKNRILVMPVKEISLAFVKKKYVKEKKKRKFVGKFKKNAAKGLHQVNKKNDLRRVLN